MYTNDMGQFMLLSLSTLTGITLVIYLVLRSKTSASVLRKCSEHFSESDTTERRLSNTNSDEKYSKAPRVFIPDVLAKWPWHRRLNPHYVQLKKESDAWAASLNPYSPRVQKIVDRGEFTLLTCLAHSALNKEHARAACDLMHFLFVVDEYCDKLRPPDVRKQKEMMLDAFHNCEKPRPKGESLIGEMARQFWMNNMQNGTKISLKRFILRIDEYMDGVIQESVVREQHRILDIKSYLELRRRTVGIEPFFSMNELGYDIPDEVMSHPVIQEMTKTALEILASCNDMVSYNIEQMRGDDLHNSITIIMNQYQTDVNGAMLWVQDHVCELADNFVAAMASLPEWEEPLNSQVKEYSNGLGQWVRGNYDWSFEGGRYLGSKGMEIKRNKWMSLMPKRVACTEFGPEEIDTSLL